MAGDHRGMLAEAQRIDRGPRVALRKRRLVEEGVGARQRLRHEQMCVDLAEHDDEVSVP
jgi:hypothetical protein